MKLHNTLWNWATHLLKHLRFLWKYMATGGPRAGPEPLGPLGPRAHGPMASGPAVVLGPGTRSLHCIFTNNAYVLTCLGDAFLSKRDFVSNKIRFGVNVWTNAGKSSKQEIIGGLQENSKCLHVHTFLGCNHILGCGHESTSLQCLVAFTISHEQYIAYLC